MPNDARYPATVAEMMQNNRAFTYHAPKEDQLTRYQSIRDKARELSLLLIDQCPPSREKSLSLTKLEEVVMWANASIARNE